MEKKNSSEVDAGIVIDVYREALKEANHTIVLQSARIIMLEEALRQVGADNAKKEVITDEKDAT